jgi:hypothetical protein
MTDAGSGAAGIAGTNAGSGAMARVAGTNTRVRAMTWIASHVTASAMVATAAGTMSAAKRGFVHE